VFQGQCFELHLGLQSCGLESGAHILGRDSPPHLHWAVAFGWWQAEMGLLDNEAWALLEVLSSRLSLKRQVRAKLDPVSIGLICILSLWSPGGPCCPL